MAILRSSVSFTLLFPLGAEHVDPPPLPVVAMLLGEDMQMYDVVDDQPSSTEVVGQILMAQAMDVHAWLPGATLLVHLAPVQ